MSYAGPPLLGAFIGYLTNKVAIRMLFRPLAPWHVWGMRVPMTPGIIPSKRHELAENIGEMVGEHLLTATDIGAALSTERFQEHLHALIERRINDILARDLGPVITVVPHRFRAYFKIGIRTLKYQLREGVYSYFHSRGFADAVSSAIEEQLDSFGNSSLNSLVSADNRAVFYQVVDDLMLHLLNGPQVADWLGKYLAKYLTDAAAEKKTVADLLPEELQELVYIIIENQAPHVLRRLSGILAEPSVRNRIIVAIRDGVDKFLDTMGPMGAMARGFIDMDELEKKIRSYLEDNEDDLAAWLEKPAVQKRVAQLLVKQTRKFLETPLNEFLADVDPEKFQTMCQQGAVQIMAVLQSPGVGQTLSNMIREHLEDMLDQGNISLAECAAMMVPAETGQRLRQVIDRELLAMLRSDQVHSLLDRMLNSMVDQLVSKPVGVLNHLVPAGIRRGMTDYLVLTTNRMLLKEVPGLVASLISGKWSPKR